MISHLPSTTTDVLSPPSEVLSPPPSPPLTFASAKDTVFDDTSSISRFLLPHVSTLNCRQFSSTRDKSPVLKSPVKYELATVISPPHHQQNSRNLEFSTSPSSCSSSSPSLLTSHTYSAYFENCSPHQNQQYQHYQDQTPEVPQQQGYSSQVFHYPGFVDNRGLFYNNSESSSNSSTNNSSTNSTHFNLRNERVSDLGDVDPLSFESDINNNNSSTTNLNIDCNNIFFHNNSNSNNNSSNITSGRISPTVIHSKVARLPPFAALLSNSPVKQRVLESNQSMMRTNENIFCENDESDVSISSSQEEAHYTNLTNVDQILHEQGHNCLDDTSALGWTEWQLCDGDFTFPKSEPNDESSDIFCLEPNMPFADNRDELIMDSPTSESDDYESSPTSRAPYSHFSTLNMYRPNGDVQQMHSYSEHESPSSSDGEGLALEDMLPDFAKLQNRADQDKISQRKRSTGLSPKERKKTMKESPSFVERERRKPGRKPGQVSNVLHLWEFMRDLLHSSECKEIIEWISKPDGVFRVMNSTEVARLWGEKKKNKKKMTYEKLSRSLRYSRLEGYFADLPRDKNYPKKLCFRFGPKSKDWR